MVEPSPECPLSPCIALLAGAWTLEILYLTSQRPMRFGELRRALVKVSSKVLAARLRELEARGVVSRRPLAGARPPIVEYALTATGRELMPVLDAVLEVSRKLRLRRTAAETGSAAGTQSRTGAGAAQRPRASALAT